MGCSEAVGKLLKIDDGFVRFVERMAVEADERVRMLEQGLVERVRTHYAPYGDDRQMMFGQYRHLSSVTQWGADSVREIVAAFRRVLLGEGPPPEGTTLSAELSRQEGGMDLSKVRIADALRGREAYVVERVFEIVRGLLVGLAVPEGGGPKSSYQSRTEERALLPGCRLFISVEQSVCSDRRFLRNESIVQDTYVYKVVTSLKEGAYESRLSDLELYESLKETCRKSIADMGRKLDLLKAQQDLTDPWNMASVMVLTKFIKSAAADLDAYDRKIRELCGERAMASTDPMAGAGAHCGRLTEEADAFGREAIETYMGSLEPA